MNISGVENRIGLPLRSFDEQDRLHRKRPPLRPPYFAHQQEDSNKPSNWPNDPRQLQVMQIINPGDVTKSRQTDYDRPPPLEYVEPLHLECVNPPTVLPETVRVSSPRVFHSLNYSGVHAHRLQQPPVTERGSSSDRYILTDCYTTEYHLPPGDTYGSPPVSVCGSTAYNRHSDRETISSADFPASPNTSVTYHRHPILDRNSRSDTKLQKDAYSVDEHNDKAVVLCIANFPFYTTKATLYRLFEDFNPLDVDVVENLPTGNPDDFTYALVTVPNKELAKKAIFELDNTQLKKQIIIVELLRGEDLSFDEEDIDSMDRRRHMQVTVNCPEYNYSAKFQNRSGNEKQMDRSNYRIDEKKRFDDPALNHRLLVDNIPEFKGKEEIFHEFSNLTAGLRDVIIYSSQGDRQKNQGFCLLEYESRNAACNAMRLMRTGWIKVWGRDLYVDWANRQLDPSEANTRNVADSLSEKNFKEALVKVENLKIDYFADRDGSSFATNERNGKAFRDSNSEYAPDKKMNHEFLQIKAKRMMQQRAMMVRKTLEPRGGRIAKMPPPADRYYDYDDDGEYSDYPRDYTNSNRDRFYNEKYNRY